jgi:hypothetical protein
MLRKRIITLLLAASTYALLLAVDWRIALAVFAIHWSINVESDLRGLEFLRIYVRREHDG